MNSPFCLRQIGVTMNRRVLFVLLIFVSELGLASCSGQHQVITCAGTGTCVNNNGTVSLTLTATPPAPSAQLSIQAFTATITGISLTNSAGSDVSVALNSTTYIAEFNRVTSDSTVLAAGVQIPADTYTRVKITYSAPRVTFCTQANAGIQGCAAGTLASVTGSAGSSSASVSLSLSVNQATGLAINVNLGNSLTFNNQAISAVNLGALNVFSAAVLPPASTDLGTGQISHVDDVMGVVTSVSTGNSLLTIHTSTRGDIPATANSSTQYGSTCSSQSFSCVQTNAVAVIDTILNANGTFTLTFYQPVFASAADLIEGVVTEVPDTVSNSLKVVVTDRIFAASNSVLDGQLNLADQVTVGLASPQPFAIVDKGLTIPFSSFDNSTSISSIQPGQTVAFPVAAYVAQSGTTPGSTVTNTFLLRLTRISATAGSVAIPTFAGNNLPPFLGFASSRQFQTTSGRLSLDAVTDLGSLPAGNTFSASVLYLDAASTPTFAAQSVRAH